MSEDGGIYLTFGREHLHSPSSEELRHQSLRSGLILLSEVIAPVSPAGRPREY